MGVLTATIEPQRTLLHPAAESLDSVSAGPECRSVRNNSLSHSLVLVIGGLHAAQDYISQGRFQRGDSWLVDVVAAGCAQLDAVKTRIDSLGRIPAQPGEFHEERSRTGQIFWHLFTRLNHFLDVVDPSIGSMRRAKDPSAFTVGMMNRQDISLLMRNPGFVKSVVDDVQGYCKLALGFSALGFDGSGKDVETRIAALEFLAREKRLS